MRTSNCLKIQPISVFLVSSKLALLHPLAFLKQGGSSQVLASGPFAVECHLEEVRLATCRRLDKFSSLEQGKADRESMFSGLYLATNVWLLRCQTSRSPLRASNLESRPCVSLHFLSLANIFLEQCGPAQGDAGCWSVSEGAGAILESPGQGHLAIGPQARSGGLPPGFRNPWRGAKLLLSEGRKHQWDAFQAVAGLPRVRAPRKKNAKFGP